MKDRAAFVFRRFRCRGGRVGGFGQGRVPVAASRHDAAQIGEHQRRHKKKGDGGQGSRLEAQPPERAGRRKGDRGDGATNGGRHETSLALKCDFRWRNIATGRSRVKATRRRPRMTVKSGLTDRLPPLVALHRFSRH